jgi:hypothetical protein
MANIECQLHWDGVNKKVVKTYKILSTDSRDHVTFSTSDTGPFLIVCKNSSLAEELGLEKAPDANGQQDLYQVKKSKPAPPLKPDEKAFLPDWLKLQCGTLVNGTFELWGGVGPDGFNDDVAASAASS